MKRSPSGVHEEGMLDHHRPPVATGRLDERLLATNARTTSGCGCGGTLECGERTRAKMDEDAVAVGVGSG